MLSEGQAEADRSYGHAGHPQPYLQHRENQEAPNNLAAGAHPSLVIIPSRSEREANHPPSFFRYPPYPFCPLPDPKTFLSSPAKHYPQGLDFQNWRPSSLTGSEAESLHPLARSDRDRRRIFPVRFGGRSPGEESTPGERAFNKELEPWGSHGAPEPRACNPAREALSRVLPRPKSPQGNPVPSSASQTLSGSPFFPCQVDERCFPRSKAELLRASPSLSSPFLCFRGNTKCFYESLGPQAERADDIQHHTPHSYCVARKSDLV